MRAHTFVVLVVVLAAAVFAGTYGLLWREQTRALRDIADLTDRASKAEPAPDTPSPELLTRSLRAMKLITVEVQTTVRSEVSDPSWRGDVTASVVAPARLLYGCDLSQLALTEERTIAGGDQSELRRNLLSGGYTLRVPRPRRIASEVYGELERTDVMVGWGRFRDLSGERQLGRARAALQQQARQAALTVEQRDDMERTTREQLATLVRGFAGRLGDRSSAVRVDVEFFDPETPPTSRPVTAGIDEP